MFAKKHETQLSSKILAYMKDGQIYNCSIVRHRLLSVMGVSEKRKRNES